MNGEDNEMNVDDLLSELSAAAPPAAAAPGSDTTAPSHTIEDQPRTVVLPSPPRDVAMSNSSTVHIDQLNKAILGSIVMHLKEQRPVHAEQKMKRVLDLHARLEVSLVFCTNLCSVANLS